MRRLERQLCETVRKQCRGQRCPVPEAGRDLAQAFGQMASARAWHANGPNPIGFHEIEAWCRLMRVPLKPEHVAIIRAMDNVWIEEFYKKRDQGAGEGMKTLPPISQQPLTAALFDAMMG